MSKVDLYSCAICNSMEQTVDCRKYYCKSHLLALHKEHKKCANHKDAVIHELSVNNDDRKDVKQPKIVEKLSFDVALM